MSIKRSFFYRTIPKDCPIGTIGLSLILPWNKKGMSHDRSSSPYLQDIVVFSLQWPKDFVSTVVTYGSLVSLKKNVSDVEVLLLSRSTSISSPLVTVTKWRKTVRFGKSTTPPFFLGLFYNKCKNKNMWDCNVSHCLGLSSSGLPKVWSRDVVV